MHTNMCILNRTFSIKQMVRWGVDIALVRDLTDAMYNPARPPYVSHEEGTRLVVEYIEKFWCPTVTSDEVLAACPRLTASQPSRSGTPPVTSRPPTCSFRRAFSARGCQVWRCAGPIPPAVDRAVHLQHGDSGRVALRHHDPSAGGHRPRAQDAQVPAHQPLLAHPAPQGLAPHADAQLVARRAGAGYL